MAKPLVVMLGDDSNRNGDMKLAKEIEESYLNENFGTLLDYVLNPNGDQLNNEYSTEDKAFAQTWRNLYEQSKSDPKIEIGISAIDKNNNAVACPFHRIIGDYSDNIIKVMTTTNDDGEITSRFKGIELFIAEMSEGGVMRYL